MTYHQPVLVDEVLHYLAELPAGPCCDATLGGGGHLRAWMAAAKGHDYWGIDRDMDAIAHGRANVMGAHLVHAHFGDLESVVAEHIGEPLAGLLLDIGVSSHQLDTAARGFSFQHGGPIDMRMDVSCGETALNLISRLDVTALARILAEFGEVPQARRVAVRIKQAHEKGKLGSTEDLAALFPKNARQHRHPATQIFQALRIAVNDEMGELDRVLNALPRLLRPGGRVGIITFHSLEDRRVKQAFRSLAHPCTCPPQLPRCACGRVAEFDVLTRHGVSAREGELEQNPRSRTARLRVAQKKSMHAGPAPLQGEGRP